jgi:hypothetical protein
LKERRSTKKEDKEILIIIPAYNEAESIGDVISSIKKTLPSADILVVNDGSADDTAKIAMELDATVINHPFNLGIGATMQTGYKFADSKGYNIAVQVDADGQHQPEEIEYLLQPLKKKTSDAVVGSRFLGQGGYKPSFARGIGMLVFSKIISTILGERSTDTTSGFRAVNKDVIRFYVKNYPEDYPEVEALVLLHKAGFKIIEAPVTMNERTGGTSSITSLRAVYYMIKVLLAVFVDLLKKVER